MIRIPDEAVEAAAKALVNADAGHSWLGWEDLPPLRQERSRGQARAALEAAAPYTLEGVWNRGFTEGIKCERGQVPTNPYRSQA
jgi:hypothetical protein